MIKHSVLQLPKGDGIGLVFIGTDRGLLAFGHDPSDEFFHAPPCGLCAGPTMPAFEKKSLLLLSRPHRATTTQFSFAHSVDIVGCADQQIEIKGPVLAVLEGSNAVENQWFAGRTIRAKLFVEEQAVATETIGLTLESAVGDTELAADLSQAGAADETMEERLEKLRVPEPVGGREGL